MNTINKSRIDWTLRLWWTVGILLTAGFLLKAIGFEWPTLNNATASVRPLTAQMDTLDSPDSSVGVSFRNIESIRVGDRVMAWNPDLEATAHKRKSEVNPATWKLLRLYCETVWDDGTVDDIHIETLQPPEWLAAHSVKVGASVPLPLDLLEMGLPPSLLGNVKAIDRCPPVADGPGQIVLTTVNHLNRYVFDLTLRDRRGRVETIGVTGHHRFFSESRHQWIAVEELRSDESLVTHIGQARVIRTDRRPDFARVFNLTVEHEHVYYVAYVSAVAHNTCAASDLPPLKGKSEQEIRETLDDAGFNQTKVSNSPGRNETWDHPDGSQVRIHPYGNVDETPFKSANNAHVHKQDQYLNQLNDRGIPSNDPAETHIGIPNPPDLPDIRGRPHGAGTL